MEISAINKQQYNVATKAQYDNYTTTDMNNYNYPAYVEEESPKSSNMLGLTLLGVLGAVGIGYGIYKHRDCKTLAKELAEKKTALEEAATKLEEQITKNETAEKALDAANKTIEGLKKPAKKPNIFKRFGNWVKNIGKKNKA